MKYGFWGIGLIAGGLIGIVFIAMFQSITVNDETEYYVLKEAMEAAMLESVDLACYRDTNKEGCGEVIKISEQKFVENFTRRFVENITGDVNSYELEFYDIIESPPKASVIVKGITQNYSIVASEGEDGTFNITNGLSGILEYEPLNAGSFAGSIILGDTDAPLDVSTTVESTTTDYYIEDGECEDCANVCETCTANTSGETTAEENAQAEVNANANEYETIKPEQNTEENTEESNNTQKTENNTTEEQSQKENEEEDKNE